MKPIHVVLLILAILILVPVLRFIGSRLSLILWLKSSKRKGLIDDYSFYSWKSVLSGIKGNHSDLTITVKDKIIVVKLIGGIRRKVIYEITSHDSWNIKYFIPLPLPVIVDREGIKKHINCKFDLVKEKSLLQSKLWNSEDNFDIEPAYFFNPVPLSVKETAYNSEKELYGGDTCQGIKIITKKTFGGIYFNESGKKGN